MLLTFFSIALMVAADQITKMLATAYLAPVGTMAFIPGIMELRYVLNSGMAFSMLSGARWILIVVTSAALLAMLWLLIFHRKKMSAPEYLALLMIVAGGIGNLIDRVLHGYVVDFFATTFVNFAVFNVADCFVCVGVVILFIALVREELTTKKKAEGSDRAA